jgi:hypothetical protein
MSWSWKSTEKALNKLRSAQTIISILQNELILAKASTTCRVSAKWVDLSQSLNDHVYSKSAS